MTRTTYSIFLMDLSFNRKAWVGNICQRFEAICQHVDGFVSQAVGVGGGEKNLPPIVVQDLVKHEELTDTKICNEEKDAEIDLNQSYIKEHNDPLESCSIKAEDSPKFADEDTDALICTHNQDPDVESNVNLEIVSLNEEQMSLDLSYSEDKNISEECVFSEPLGSKFSPEEEEICCDPANSIVLVSESCSTLDGDKKDVEIGFTLSNSDLSLKSNDTESGRAYDNVSLTGSPRYEDEDGWKLDQIEDIISSSEIGEVDLFDINSENGSMERINLSDDENLDKSCVVVDSTPVYSFSSRPRKFISYKKIIQDAFNSRKRLAKEYEQLEILYGNIDEDPDEIKALITFATNPSFKAKKSASEETEWELV